MIFTAFDKVTLTVIQVPLECRLLGETNFFPASTPRRCLNVYLLLQISATLHKPPVVMNICCKCSAAKLLSFSL